MDRARKYITTFLVLCLHLSDRLPLKWLPMTPVSWWSHLCVISSPWWWVGFNDFILMNRLQQVWWDFIFKIRLQKNCGFHLACFLLVSPAHTLERKAICHIVRCPLEKPLQRDTEQGICQQPARNWGPLSAHQPVRNWILLTVMWVNLEKVPFPNECWICWLPDCSLVADPEPERPS